MSEIRERLPRNIQPILQSLSIKYLNGQLTNGRWKMGIAAPAKERNQPVLRKVNQWVRHYPGSLSTPSQQALETNTRDAYFWRR